MDFLGKLDLFSRTVDNRFVFNLFDLLLCGVIVLVILRTWRAHRGHGPGTGELLLLLAFSCLGGSFAVGAIFSGASFFFQLQLSEFRFDFLTHSLQAGAWLLLTISAYRRRSNSGEQEPVFQGKLYLPLLLLFAFSLQLARSAQWDLLAATAFDWVNFLLLTAALVCFHRWPLDRGKLATAAVALLTAAGFLHLLTSFSRDTAEAVILWNLEQSTWSLSLFLFALAIGETGQDLFDRVFVRLQVAFILLASVMILVIVQTEKTEYLASIRSRSEQLADFVRAQVGYFRQHNEPLQAILDRGELLRAVTLGFGNLPELKIIRIVAGEQFGTFGITDGGAIHRIAETLPSAHSLPPVDLDRYFLIHSLALEGTLPGRVEFYGTREFLDPHIRKRILLIFLLFTGMVGLSTVMIGLVVRGASATIRQQAQEIERTERQLMQASKLAAIGELAAGVAHEINNPATTILSRASLLLSVEEPGSSASDREDLQAIVTQAQRIAQITRGLLMFSRPQVPDVKAASIHRVIEAALSSIQEPLILHHISVQNSVRLDLPRVLADENSLGRALENIFRNAVEAMPQGGRLQIRAAKQDPAAARLRVEISDTGIGIPAENLTRIFDPFFTTKEVGKGTGLGLSIAHGIIQEHRGAITVESQPGTGTKFTIVLPTEH